jgi:aryl-alcohol dehydrogenase-like predicted oxidoreductase
VLAALGALRDLQAAGKVRRIGIAGYPLPTLLRLARLAQAAGHPVDVVQSYAHHTLQCSTLPAFLGAFEAAGVRQVVNAAPLAMGILTAGGGPEWHPAKFISAVYGATRRAVADARERGTSIEEVACNFGYRPLVQGNGAAVPCVIGCTDLQQLHATLQAFGRAQRGEAEQKVLDAEAALIAGFKERGVHNVSWQSPAPKDM